MQCVCDRLGPGDYVRFLREVVRAARIELCVTNRNITIEQFYSDLRDHKRMTDIKNTTDKRRIMLDMPKLSLTRLIELIEKFQPTTPRIKYTQYLNS